MATAKKVSKKAATKKAAAKKVAKKAAAKKVMPRKAALKRTLMEPTPGDKRYVRRDPKGQFKDVVDAGKSISANMRSTTKTKAKPGQGDKGDTNL